jgi:phosphate starvation-inducible protein PhoH and related proteins
MTTQRKITRKKKVGDGPVVSEKFAEVRVQKVFDLKAKTENQTKALKLLKEKKVVVLRGSSGSGKSYIGCIHAANEYLKGNVKKIVLIRPYEMVARTIGMRPGSGEDKLRPLMQSMLQYLELVFGKAELEAKIASGTVVLEALEDCRGRSYEDSWVICDEAQNIDSHGMKALVTRLNENSKICFCGDGKQKDTRSDSGIDALCDVIARVRKDRPAYLSDKDMWEANNNFGVVTFTHDDVVRSGFTALMVKVIDNDWN